LYQDLFKQIDDYEQAASIPSESEKNRVKLDADRANLLRDRRSGIEALRPSAEQKRLRKRGVGFGALSRVLARTGDPRKRQDFGQIGEDVRGELDRQLAQDMGFEEVLSGVDTDIYGVESGSLGRQAQRELAGREFWGPTIEALQSQAEARNDMRVAAIKAQQDSSAFTPSNLDSWIAFLNSAEFELYGNDETREIITNNISRMAAGLPPTQAGQAAQNDILALMQQAEAGGATLTDPI